MAGSLGTAVLELRTDAEEIGRGLGSAGGKLREWGGKMISAGGDIANGLRPLTDSIKGIMSDSLEMASSTEESLNKVRVVFREAAGGIEAWAKDSAQNLGISNQKALEAAGTFGNLFTAMGLGRKPAADLSMDVVQLASDLASFNNIKPEEALEKLRAGLVGEAEPLRTLGVNLSAAAVEAWAMKNGVGEAGRELTDAEKITARYGLIVEQTKNAQGDFKNTSDGLANSLRIQKAEQENVQAQLGVALIPVMKELTKVVTGVVQWFSNLSPEAQKVIMIIGGLLVVLGPLVTILGVVASGVGIVVGILGALSVAAGTGTLAIGALSVPFWPLIAVIGALVAAVLILKLAWENNLGDIQGKTQAVVGFLMDLWEGFQLLVLGVFRAIVVAVAGAVNEKIGILNGFVRAYNEMATRLGLPTIGEIQLITPNLTAVDAAIDAVAATRNARINVSYNMPPMPAPGQVTGPYAEGTDHITRGPEIFMAGEAGPERVQVTPLAGGTASLGGGAALAAGHGHDVVMDGRVVAGLIGRRTVRGTAIAGGAIG